MKKSLNFGIDNIFVVPPGQPLRILDIYNWRALEFDIEKISILLNRDYLQRMKNQIELAETRLFDAEPHPSDSNVKERIATFMSGFEKTDVSEIDFHKGVQNKDKIFSPQSTTFWLRISDEPVESFFDEDYAQRSAQPETDSAPLMMPLSGSLYLECIHEFETALPVGQGRSEVPFILAFEPDATFRSINLPAFEFLPVVDEFCGSFGSSGRGIMVNYTQYATISEESLAAVPLFKLDHHYETLYFSLSTSVEYTVITQLTEKVYKNFAGTLTKAGFQAIKQKGENFIFRRGDDVLHLYGDVPGKESLSGSRFMPHFIIAVANDADTSPAARAELLKEIL